VVVENEVRFDRCPDSCGAYKVAHRDIVPAAARAGEQNTAHVGVSQSSNADWQRLALHTRSRKFVSDYLSS
jgi:hypothetical protein